MKIGTPTFDKHQNGTLYQIDSSVSINLPFATVRMSRVHSLVRAKSPSHTTEELLGRMLAQMKSLTFSFNMLKRENDNRIEEIYKLAKKVGCSGEVETDKETTQRQEVTNETTQENLRFRNESIYAESNVRFPVPSASHIVEDERIKAEIAIETICGINGQDDIGIEDFIKTVKKAKDRFAQPNLLLDLIIAKKITGFAEKLIRYLQINSYEDLYDALRQNFKSSNSILALKSKLESCKQGATESVQNFSLRFRQIINEIKHAVQVQHVNPIERRLKITFEEQEAVNRYLLNLGKEISTQIRLLKPNTITEAHTHAIETEMWLKESQPARTQVVTRPVLKYLPRPQPLPRDRANTNGIRTPHHSLPLADRVKMNRYKCLKAGHFANQCHVKQGFQPDLNGKRPPQPVKMLQEENTDATQMTAEEIQEKIDYEDSAEFLLYAEDSDLLEQLETRIKVHSTHYNQRRC